jgi:hypothetical protein
LFVFAPILFQAVAAATSRKEVVCLHLQNRFGNTLVAIPSAVGF